MQLYQSHVGYLSNIQASYNALTNDDDYVKIIRGVFMTTNKACFKIIIHFNYAK